MSGFAYFISAYKDPGSIVRLVNALAQDSDQFYIHFDKKVEDKTFNRWKSLIEKKCRTENIQIISKYQCKWGAFGIVDATLSAMNFFEDSEYDYFINLTGECYPLKPPQQIKDAFRDEKAGFMVFWKLPYEAWYQGGMARINKRTFFLPQKKYPYVKLINIPRFRKKIPGNLEPYGGWSLFCLPKDIVSYALKFTEKNPEVKSFFKRVFAPGEMFFQTILMNSPYRHRIINDHKRYMDFVDSHPRVLTKDDFGTLKTSGKLFARKFDPTVDEEVLDLIDKENEEQVWKQVRHHSRKHVTSGARHTRK